MVSGLSFFVLFRAFVRFCSLIVCVGDANTISADVCGFKGCLGGLLDAERAGTLRQGAVATAAPRDRQGAVTP